MIAPTGINNEQLPLHNEKYMLRPMYISFLFSLVIGLGYVVFGERSLPLLTAFLVFTTNILYSFERTNSKPIALLLLIVAYLLMVATNNTSGGNGDYRAYEGLYNHFKDGGTLYNIIGYRTDYVFMLFLSLVAKLNISYNMFLALIVPVSVLLIHSTVSKFTSNYNLVLSCYILTPFFYDVFQVRFFIAYSIVVFALQYIIIEQKKNYLKYVLLVSLASLFHNTILFFLLYFVLKIKIKSIFKIILMGSIFIAAANFITKRSMVDILSSFISFSKFESYSSQVLMYNINPLTSLAIILITSFFILVIKFISDKNPTYTNRQLLWLNLLGILLFPFFLISLDFERFLRPVMLINYAVIAQNIGLFSNKKFLIFSLIMVLCFRQYLMVNVTEVILVNNYVLEYFYKFLDG